jgi:hypothetical protein
MMKTDIAALEHLGGYSRQDALQDRVRVENRTCISQILMGIQYG